MPSTSLADYQVLLDGEVTLEDALGAIKQKTLNFTMPSDFLFEDGIRKPIIAFKVRVDKDSSFKVFVNHREVASFNLDQSHTRGYWESWNAKTAFPDGVGFNNPVPVMFSLLSGGKIVISDVVMWYQVKV